MANLTGNLKDSMTATFPREFDIPNAMTIQEIYDKLNARAAAFQMPFSVKGGIPGERVVFEKEPNLDVIIWLHVKNGTHIKITPVTQDSSATINGIDVGKNSVMRKGVKGVASRPLLQGQYIDGVTDTIKKILADETVPDYVAPAVMPGADKPLSWLTLLLLCIFVGGAGIHRFQRTSFPFISSVFYFTEHVIRSVLCNQIDLPKTAAVIKLKNLISHLLQIKSRCFFIICSCLSPILLNLFHSLLRHLH